MISVIVPTYNDGRRLHRALASVRAQTIDDWECIVVDDGSDPPVDPNVGAADPRIRFVRHRSNLGRGAARATGLGHARGAIIAWQDADDWSHPDRLEFQKLVLDENPAVEFVGTGAFVTEAGTCVGVLRAEPITPRTLAPMTDVPLLGATLMFRRRVLRHVSYNPRHRIGEDHVFLLRALRRFAFCNRPELLYVHATDDSYSLAKYMRHNVLFLAETLKLWRVAPRRAALRCLRLTAGLAAHPVAAAVGAHRRLMRRRQAPPSLEAVRAFQAASARVAALMGSDILGPGFERR